MQLAASPARSAQRWKSVAGPNLNFALQAAQRAPPSPDLVGSGLHDRDVTAKSHETCVGSVEGDSDVSVRDGRE